MPWIYAQLAGEGYGTDKLALRYILLRLADKMSPVFMNNEMDFDRHTHRFPGFVMSAILDDRRSYACFKRHSKIHCNQKIYCRVFYQKMICTFPSFAHFNICSKWVGVGKLSWIFFPFFPSPFLRWFRQYIAICKSEFPIFNQFWNIVCCFKMHHRYRHSSINQTNIPE